MFQRREALISLRGICRYYGSRASQRGQRCLERRLGDEDAARPYGGEDAAAPFEAARHSGR
jgi:hypothetical protein